MLAALLFRVKALFNCQGAFLGYCMQGKTDPGQNVQEGPKGSGTVAGLPG